MDQYSFNGKTTWTKKFQLCTEPTQANPNVFWHTCIIKNKIIYHNFASRKTMICLQICDKIFLHCTRPIQTNSEVLYVSALFWGSKAFSYVLTKLSTSTKEFTYQYKGQGFLIVLWTEMSAYITPSDITASQRTRTLSQSFVTKISVTMYKVQQ